MAHQISLKDKLKGFFKKLFFRCARPNIFWEVETVEGTSLGKLSEVDIVEGLRKGRLVLDDRICNGDLGWQSIREALGESVFEISAFIDRSKAFVDLGTRIGCMIFIPVGMALQVVNCIHAVGFDTWRTWAIIALIFGVLMFIFPRTPIGLGFIIFGGLAFVLPWGLVGFLVGVLLGAIGGGVVGSLQRDKYKLPEKRK